jgi:tetratricopeptide (TPR) repeat protein
MRLEQDFMATLNAHPLRVVALFLVVVLLAYANSFLGVFQFDDFNVIVNNARVHTWSAWWQDLQGGIRPLLKLTYTLDWTLGWGETGYHLSNVLIHFCNTVLVWLLSQKLLVNYPVIKNQAALSIFAALLFAVHPAHTEAVTYICGRSSALMSLFYLAGLLIYAHGRTTKNIYLLHLLTPLCLLLALAVKETAVTFVIALLLWELYNGGSLKSAIRLQWTSWLLMLLSAVFFLLHKGYLAEMATSAEMNNLSGNLATQTMAFSYLLRQWLLPLWLNIDPPLQVLHDFSSVLPQLIFLLSLLALTLLSFRRRPWLSFALAWTLLQLFPLYVFLPRLDVANERQLYLVSWPLALVVAIELSMWLKGKIFKVSIVLLLLALGGLTILSNQDYQSEIALWESTVKRSPNKARVQNNLGYAYMLAGRVEEARTAFDTTLALDPQYYQARYNLLRLEQQFGERPTLQPIDPN